MKHLRGFDYVSYLKRRMLVGQLDPWRIDDDGKPFYALLTTLDFAIDECRGWSGQDIGRKEFKDYLALNNIWTLKNVEELQKVREERKLEKIKERERKKHKKEISPERREELRNRMIQLNKNRQPSISENPQ